MDWAGVELALVGFGLAALLLVLQPVLLHFGRRLIPNASAGPAVKQAAVETGHPLLIAAALTKDAPLTAEENAALGAFAALIILVVLSQAVKGWLRAYGLATIITTLMVIGEWLYMTNVVGIQSPLAIFIAAVPFVAIGAVEMALGGRLGDRMIRDALKGAR